MSKDKMTVWVTANNPKDAPTALALQVVLNLAIDDMRDEFEAKMAKLVKDTVLDEVLCSGSHIRPLGYIEGSKS